MGKFELWIGCFGNGMTICNKAVEYNGDYKTVAHISEAGHIKWYVPLREVPINDIDRIINLSEDATRRAKQEIENALALSTVEKWAARKVWKYYEEFAELMPWGKYRNMIEKKLTVGESVVYMFNELFALHRI